MSALVMSVEPAEEPITLEEAKAHLRVDIEDDDQLILNLITAARQKAESILKRALITQTLIYYPDDFPDEDYIELPMPPLQSVTSIIYTDYAGTATTMTVTTDYVVDIKKEPGRVVLAYGQVWPSTTLTVTSPIAITFIAGFGTPEDVPMAVKAAILIITADYYENRESYVIGQTPTHMKTVEALLDPYVIHKF